MRRKEARGREEDSWMLGTLKVTEDKVTCQKKGEKIKSPKRKIIRVESEETQDYVKGAKGTDQEEAGEVSFVPIAIGVPQKLMFRCDHQCRYDGTLGSSLPRHHGFFCTHTLWKTVLSPSFFFLVL